MSIYDFTVKDNEGNDVSLSYYKGKVLLIVNTATKWGFTPQYGSLQKLYEKYNERGFEILDFPCNQFLNQAPGTDPEIQSFCEVSYGTTYKRFKKIDVNGKNADPLYVYLKKEASNELLDEENLKFRDKLEKLSQKFIGSEIKWNFTKFLIGRDGKVVERFAPIKKPEDIEPYIEKLL